MLFIEDLWPLLCPPGSLEKSRLFKESLLQSMSNTSCESAELEACRDESVALVLKLSAVALILVAGVVGVSIPLVGRNRSFLRTDGSLFIAAGVFLATRFVHMLSGGSDALNKPCLPEFPWTKFPFSGFFAMMASLATLLVDFVGTQYYERKRRKARPAEDQVRVGSDDPEIVASVGPGQPAKEWNGKVFGEEEGGGMHIVGMHAHAAHHRHSHAHGQVACDGHVTR